MAENGYLVMDGNEAVAHVAYALNEVIAIYPITPSSPMGEWSDAWAAEQKPNLWGTVPTILEMQSEGGAAGAVHGALQTGSLACTFTSSQGLLLMIPNMYKIAGELTSAVIHVAARTVATHALSIFGDHSDVMAVRQTGWGMLSSASVQEAMDFAAIAQAVSLESRIPFIHFMDGFRTSHEVAKVLPLTPEQLRQLVPDHLVSAHRQRALTPDHPVVRGTAQNPDVFFQAREAVNPYYDNCASIVERVMDRFGKVVGRPYRLFEYVGAPNAERVIVMMGSGCEAAMEAVQFLADRGEPVGLVKVRLYRPFDSRRFVESLPATTRSIAVLDRTKEPGATAEPLFLDVVAALQDGINNGWGDVIKMPRVINGRYGLSSKEFTPAMVRGVLDHLTDEVPKSRFTVGIEDDVTRLSLPFNPSFRAEPENRHRALFYGLGSDGTVGANKNSIKIIGEMSDNYAQGYFVYDSKKSGAVTVSHLRFGPGPIHSTYLIDQAEFVACHQQSLLERYDVLEFIRPGGTFLLNSVWTPEEIWEKMPPRLLSRIIARKPKFYVIDAYKVAREAGLGGRINTVMQVCFFKLANVLPLEKALDAIRGAIIKSYKHKGEGVVDKNLKAVDAALANLIEIDLSKAPRTAPAVKPLVPDLAPEFVRNVTARILEGHGDALSVGSMPVDGTFPSDTARWEKRNLAMEIPVWDEKLCIQCGKCTMVCPHSALRIKVYPPEELAGAPASFRSMDAKDKEWAGFKYTIQVAPEDCTGCTLCVDVCPARSKTDADHKALDMAAQTPILEQERENWDHFVKLPEADRTRIKQSSIRSQQLQQPLFEFSGACTGCGETPYVKLLTQLYGDRLLMANATGCSSIYGGNLPTTPYTKNAEGRGPAWANSLFEDNAEFGLGFRVSIDKQAEFAGELLRKLAGQVGETLAEAILTCPQKDEASIHEQRGRIELLREKLSRVQTPEARMLLDLADYLVKKSVWIVGGDGWAYDIGFGGLDHVLASGKNVNLMVLDTEVYSNTGGQCSKSTPLGAIAKFAASGKKAPKKDLGLMAMTYGTVYVARVAMGAKDEQSLRAILEAEAYDGPSLIIAYSHCIAHGIEIADGLQHQKLAVETGQWPLYRFNPDRVQQGQNPMILDSKAPTAPLEKYLALETRFATLTKGGSQEAKQMLEAAQANVDARRKLYEYLAGMTVVPEGVKPS